VRRLELSFALTVLVTCLGGCGDESSSVQKPAGARASIRQSAEAYFLHDENPKPDVYCRSHVSVREPETLPSGPDFLATAEEVQPALEADADYTEDRCHQTLELYLAQVPHTGYRDAEIGAIKVQGIRGHVMATYKDQGRTVTRNAFVGRIGPGDWRILNAGWD
jgi:hypothetical protein